MRKYLVFGKAGWVGEVKASKDGRIVAYTFRYGVVPGSEFRELAECETVNQLKRSWTVTELKTARG